jgi:hypothetical protein
MTDPLKCQELLYGSYCGKDIAWLVESGTPPGRLFCSDCFINFIKKAAPGSGFAISRIAPCVGDDLVWKHHTLLDN